MNPKIIAVIYFYLVSFVSLILIVMGIFSTVNFLINTTQFSEYPLPYYDNCENQIGLGRPISPDAKSEASLSASEREEMLKRCKENLERRRTQQRIDDLKGAITFSLVGLILFGIHFPLARKQTK